jgi:molybdopterin molybdotransferase
MIPFEQAFDIVMNAARPIGTERIRIEQSLNRILAEDVASDMDMPPFDKAAMDGYACRRADLDRELIVVETIAAGAVPNKAIGENQCAKIMTGAAIPKGADCVIMVEFTEQLSEQTIRFTGKHTADNICLRAEDIKSGQVILCKGARIQPEHIAVLATVGCVEPLVARQPRVGIIATGDELVEPSARPSTSQIRNSNSYQLAAQAADMGAIPRYYGIAKDTNAAIDTLLKKAVEQSDVVLLSGGVSMGDLDLVPDILKKNKIKLLFENIAIKPGKPTVFGLSDKIFCFGLPGNPVSTFVVFEILVKPFLYKMMGHNFRPASIRAPLAKTVSLKRTDRDTFMPAALTDSGTAAPMDYHGSADISAICGADGLIRIPAGITELREGMLVQIRTI